MSTVNTLLPSLMQRLGVAPSAYTGGTLRVTSPIDGSELGCLAVHPAQQVQQLVDAAHQAFLSWRKTPAPRRGELIRLLGEELRLAKNDLGQLVSLEAGKILSEGLGEVQEMIDICDFAVGLSQLLIGTREVGEALVNHPKAALISATGNSGLGGPLVGPTGQQEAGRFGDGCALATHGIGTPQRVQVV